MKLSSELSTINHNKTNNAAVNGFETKKRGFSNVQFNKPNDQETKMNTQLTTKNNTTVTDLFACLAMQGSFCCLVCNSWYVGTYHFENESAANRIPYLLIYL